MNPGGRAIARAPACCMPGCNQPGVQGSGVDLLAVPPRWGRWLCLAHGKAGQKPAAAPQRAEKVAPKAPAAPTEGRLL